VTFPSERCSKKEDVQFEKNNLLKSRLVKENEDKREAVANTVIAKRLGRVVCTFGGKLCVLRTISKKEIAP